MGDRTEVADISRAGAGTLGDIVESLGPRTLRVLAAPGGMQTHVSGTVLYDRFETLPQGHGALLFASGLRESDPGWTDLIGRAANSGYSGVVLKRWSSDPHVPVAAAIEGKVALLSTPPETHWRDLDALISGLIAVNAIGADASPGDHQELLVLVNTVASVAGGSVVIEDLNRRVLEYSSVEGQRIDAVREAGILAHQVPDVPSNPDQYRQIYAAQGAVHFDAVGEELPRSAIAIRAGTRPLGTIWVIEGPGGLPAQGLIALLNAASLAALQLLKTRHNRAREADARSAALLAALEGSFEAGKAASRSLPAADDDLALIGFAPAVRPTEAGTPPEPDHAEIGAMLTRYFASFCPDASVATTERAVFVLAPVEARSVDRLVAAALAAPGRPPGECLKAAIAYGATDLSELPSMRSEVEDVLAVTTSEPDLPVVARLADVYSRVVLEHVATVLHDHPRLRHTGIEAMTAHDQARQTEYSASVLAWLDAVGDITEASVRIGVHPNTLRYRLRRAGELFDFDLDQPDDRLAVWLHLRLV